MKKNIWFIAGSLGIIAVGIIVCLYLFLPEKKPDAPQIVCLDPGHGGKDAGAVSDKRYEKDDNLRLALRVGEILKENDIQYFLTRESDVEVSLEDRCNTANSKNATLFVSFHRNSGGASGLELWLSSTHNKEEFSFANAVYDELLVSSQMSDRGIKTGTADNPLGNLYVNAHTNMNSCLIEFGFIDSSVDNKLFDNNFEAMAQSVAKTIIDAT